MKMPWEFNRILKLKIEVHIIRIMDNQMTTSFFFLYILIESVIFLCVDRIKNIFHGINEKNKIHIQWILNFIKMVHLFLRL